MIRKILFTKKTKDGCVNFTQILKTFLNVIFLYIIKINIFHFQKDKKHKNRATISKSNNLHLHQTRFQCH